MSLSDKLDKYAKHYAGQVGDDLGEAATALRLAVSVMTKVQEAAQPNEDL